MFAEGMSWLSCNVVLAWSSSCSLDLTLSFISIQSANGFPDLKVVDISCDYYGLDRRNDQLLYRWDSNDILLLNSNPLIKCDWIYIVNLNAILHLLNTKLILLLLIIIIPQTSMCNL